MESPPEPAEPVPADGADTTDAADTADAAKRMLAARIRSLASMTVVTTVDDETLTEASALVGQALDLISRSARSGRYDGLAGLAPGADTNGRIWETHAAFGGSNPLAPPILVEEYPGRLVGTLTFGGAWEGGPGTVYGGFIAAAFDGMMGRAVISAGHLGVTRSIEVRYLRPTPLHTPLSIESTAGPRDGRNVAVTGRLWHGATLTCEAEAVFACVDPERYRA